MATKKKAVAKKAPAKKNPAKKAPAKKNPAKKSSVARKQLGIVERSVMPAVIGASAGLSVDMIMGYIQPKLPPMLQGGFPNAIAKLLTGVGLGMLATKFKDRKFGDQVMTGTMATTIYGYGYDIIGKMAPNVQLAGMGFIDTDLGYIDTELGYIDNNMGYISPAMVASVGDDFLDDDDDLGGFDYEDIEEAEYYE